MNVKQVIVLRKDLNMRKGKMVAQGSHASLQAIVNEGYVQSNELGLDILVVPLTNEVKDWLTGTCTKICVGVNSEQELFDIFYDAEKAGLFCSIIQDAGLTEFKEPTFTAVAIGPGDAEEIDKITGHLKLL